MEVCMSAEEALFRLITYHPLNHPLRVLGLWLNRDAVVESLAEIIARVRATTYKERYRVGIRRVLRKHDSGAFQRVRAAGGERPHRTRHIGQDDYSIQSMRVEQAGLVVIS